MKTEDWLLEQLDIDPPPMEAIRGALAEADAEGRRETADSWAQLAQETLAAKGRTDDAMQLLADRANVWDDTAETRETARRQAAEVAAGDRTLRKLMEESGFGPDLPAAEAIRRLRVLQSLEPGAVCYDATWGIGEVKRIDLFYKKLTLDFESRRNHAMAFSYAAESLQMLPPDHLFARWKHGRQEVEEDIRERPGKIVRETVRWFGPQPVAQVRDLLIPRLLRDNDWKDFWDRARKELKKDPLFEIPSRRSEPLRILTAEENFGSTWFADLSAERDMDTVLDLLESLVDQPESADLSEERRRIAADRLSFVVTGSSRRPDLRARAALVRDALGIPAEDSDQAHPASFFDRKRFLRTARDLPARHVGPFLELLRRQDEERAIELFAGCLPRAGGSVLNELIQSLASAGREDLCRKTVQDVFARKEPHIELLSWLHRNPDAMGRWVCAEAFDQANLTLDALEREAAGDLLKSRNLLRDRCARDEWLRETLGAMTPDQRREWVARLKNTRAWASLDRQSIIGRVIKMFPDCQAVMSREAEAAPEESRTRLTSQRSYLQRQAIYRRLVEVDIPSNSRDIAEARSHGDLRENAEYKAAKEMQGILMQRRAEAERDLKIVQPTTFEQPFSGRIAPGAGVTLAYPDGRTESYWILGEWDSDERLQIIPSSARLARSLEGHREGDEVTVPGIDGETVCTVQSVHELSEDIRSWIESEPAPVEEEEPA